MYGHAISLRSGDADEALRGRTETHAGPDTRTTAMAALPGAVDRA